MNYIKINNDSRIQPSVGVYSDWKEQIASDCFFQCVYCAIPESRWGGIDNYHIDHFKPQSIFDELTHIIINLFYACPICNRFKSKDWPSNSGDINAICYPNPSDFDYNDLFEIDGSNFKLKGKYTASIYLINRLYLNRPQLIFERREAALTDEANGLIRETMELLTASNGDIGSSLTLETVQAIGNLTLHINKRNQIRPYKLLEIRKPSGK
jgi:hypothetical protein